MANVAWPRTMTACRHGLRRGEPAYLIATEPEMIFCQECADAIKAFEDAPEDSDPEDGLCEPGGVRRLPNG